MFWKEIASQLNELYLYGNDERTEIYLKYFEENNMPLSGIVQKESDINGKNILVTSHEAMRGLSEKELLDAGGIVLVPEKEYLLIEQSVKKNEAEHIGEHIKDVLLYYAKVGYRKIHFLRFVNGYNVKNKKLSTYMMYGGKYGESGQIHLIHNDIMVMRFPLFPTCKFKRVFYEKANLDEVNKWCEGLCFFDNHEHSSISKDIYISNNMLVYAATSGLDVSNCKDIENLGLIPLLVGAAFSDSEKKCLRDDLGDNISKKNRNYSECTGLYWIWKNTSGQDYVGLCHYRRHLELDKNRIAEVVDDDIDVIAPLPQFEVETIKVFFERFIGEVDWNIMKKSILEVDMEYQPIIEKYENGYFYFPCNLEIWKRKWFDKYCEFAFEVANKVEAYFECLNVYREDRYMGYLFEQLSTLFILKNSKKMKIVCAPIAWVEWKKL